MRLLSPMACDRVQLVVGRQQLNARSLRHAGRIGWIAKGIVYGLIGGLCCRGAISDDLNVDASPQVLHITATL